MSQFAPLSLAPAFTQHAPEAAFNGSTFNQAPFAGNNVFSLDNAFPSYFSPGSPLEQHASPSSSFNSGSDRESSPASSFLPTPAGSPKMAHIDINQSNNIGQQQWAQYDFGAEMNGSKGMAYPAQHQQFNMAPQYTQQPIYQNNIMYHQQPQYYQQQQPQQMIQPQTFYLPNNQVMAPQPPSFGMSIAQAQPQYAPQFETPQGTYFFVPASVMPVSSSIGLGPIMAPSPGMSVGSTESWDQLASIPLPPVELSFAPDEDVKPVQAAVKAAPVAGKKTSAPKKKNTTKRFMCPHPGCGRAFARNFNLGSHVKSHLGIRDFNCPSCPKKFSRRHDRARHCAAVHDIHHIVDEEDVDECEA